MTTRSASLVVMDGWMDGWMGHSSQTSEIRNSQVRSKSFFELLSVEMYPESFLYLEQLTSLINFIIGQHHSP